MTATLEDLLADFRDLLEDDDDAAVPGARKARYFNRALRAMYPKMFVLVTDSTIVLAADTYHYLVPVAASGGMVCGVELESDAGSGRYLPLHGHYLRPAEAQPSIELTGATLPAPVGSRIRITAAMPFTDFDVTEPLDVDQLYPGPAGSEELPVLYGMGLVAGRRVDQRLDFKRYSTTQSLNAVTERDLMVVAQNWFQQFELLLDRWTMALPSFPE